MSESQGGVDPVRVPLTKGHQGQLALLRAETAAAKARYTVATERANAVEQAIVQAVLHSAGIADLDRITCEITADALVVTPKPVEG